MTDDKIKIDEELENLPINEVDSDEDMSGLPEVDTETEEATPRGPKEGVVTTPNNGPLNLRANPDKKSVALTSIPAGTKIQYTEFSDEWVIVRFNEFEGYCMKKFIE